MKNSKSMYRLLIALMLVLFVAALPMVASAADDDGHSDHVGDRVKFDNRLPIPRGHYDIIAAQANKYLSGTAHRTIFADTLVDGIDDPVLADELNDFFILDIRLPADYTTHHIMGSINVPFAEVAQPLNLAKLPVDRPILVVCYTGHTASNISAILNVLGYNAWTLRFGMMSWDAQTNMKVWSATAAQTIFGAGYNSVQ